MHVFQLKLRNKKIDFFLVVHCMKPKRFGWKLEIKAVVRAGMMDQC